MGSIGSIWLNESSGVLIPHWVLFPLVAATILVTSLSIRQIGEWEKSSSLGQLQKLVVTSLVVVLMALPFMVAPEYLLDPMEISSRGESTGAPVEAGHLLKEGNRYFEVTEGNQRIELSRGKNDEIMREGQQIFLRASAFFSFAAVIGFLATTLLARTKTSRNGS